MATATLKGAMSFFHDGVKYLKDEPVVVKDQTAKELAELDGYFNVKFGEDKAEDKPSKIVVKKAKEVVQSVAQTDEPAVGI